MEISEWVHLDIAGVMESHGEHSYLSKGMSGEPKEKVLVISWTIQCMVVCISFEYSAYSNMLFTV